SRPFDYAWLDAPAMARINRDYLPEDLEPHLREVGVERTIFVQTQHDVAETRWVLDLAERHPFLAGVVGWVDLTSPDVEGQLRGSVPGGPSFAGARHLTQDEPADDFILRDDVLRGLSVLARHAVPFDLLFHVRHLPHAATVAARLPDLPLVLDHLGKPDIGGR